MTKYEHSAIPFDVSGFACIDFVNSAFTDYRGTGPSTDRLQAGEWRRWFLSTYDVIPDDVDAPPLADLVALRSDVRRILEKWASGVQLSRRDAHLLDGLLRSAAFRTRLASRGGELELWKEPLERSWGWVTAAVAESVVELLRDGDPARLKSCDNPDCTWMFYDTTINRSRRFCSTSPCGSLIRVRRFRERA